jgi:FkbM family methyltransferase
MLRPLKTIKFITSQLIKMSGKADEAPTFIRFAIDLFLIRAARLFSLSPSNRERKIRLHGGINLTYRLNPGDMQSIREVWLDEAYKLPFTPKPGILIDLGAHIGLTSLWLARRYGYSTIIAVEPSPSNARLACMNLENNNIKAEIVEAAIGPIDGTMFFDDNEISNLGHISAKGRPIQMLSMQTLLQRIPTGESIELVKMDIEGGEEALLQGELTWLNRVRSIIAEFHPPVIDYSQAIRVLQKSGFYYIAAGSAHKDSMDAFVR